ncbi:MAG: PKD domain-containing protein, partial [Deltaproteobacteria bacterium]|nr:PKD domain-containing protein [Deltaproteobacteria bacterium]
APVARLTPLTISAIVGETVQLDASASFDEDGTIIGYQWDYGEGAEPQLDLNPAARSNSGGNSGEAQSSHVYYDSGQYTVTLTVTDSQGATATVQAEVNVEPLKFGVYFSRSRLNLKSKGKWITATIRAPAGYDARGIDAENLYLVVSDDIAPIPAHQVYLDKGYRKHHKKKYRSHRIRNLKAKFDRQALIGALGDFTGITSLKVTGEISTGKARLEFAGKGNIKAFVKKKKKARRSYNWKQVLSFFSKGKSK